MLTQKFLDRMCVPYKFFFSPSTCSSDWGWNGRGFNPIFWSPQLSTVPLPECQVVSCGHRAVGAVVSASPQSSWAPPLAASLCVRCDR